MFSQAETQEPRAHVSSLSTESESVTPALWALRAEAGGPGGDWLLATVT